MPRSVASFRPSPQHPTFGQCVKAALQASSATALKQHWTLDFGSVTLDAFVKPQTPAASYANLRRLVDTTTKNQMYRAYEEVNELLD